MRVREQMSRGKTIALKPVDTKAQVVNQSQKKARDLSVAVQRDEAEIARLETTAKQMMHDGRKKQAQSLASQIIDLRRQRDSKMRNLRLLSKNLNGLSEAIDTIEVQKSIKEITEQKNQLLNEVDIVDLLSAGEESRASDIGLEELLQMAGATEENDARYEQDAANLLDELMQEDTPSPVMSTTTTTTTTTRVTSPPPQRPKQRVNEKYKDTAKLLDF